MSCKCATECGDDPDVMARRVLGCHRYRARRDPDRLGETINRLRASLQSVVTLLDRMEPEVAEADRASDDEWIATKAAAKVVLAETE